MPNEKLAFASDYMEGAHPAILNRLCSTNLLKTPGYGADSVCASARDRIRDACGCPDAAVHFLTGGTQTNATVIDALLRPYQGVISAESGHIAAHEAGAIEFGGHKVLALPHTDGKLSADAIRACYGRWRDDPNHEHTVMPGMVYLSQPTEYGTLYSLTELASISEACRACRLRLYIDGARLAYALASPANDATLRDLARLCDVFYIGGTKCGALLGEAVVIPDPDLLPHFFTTMKQHGALLAKGRLLGLQFDVLFADGLYLRIGKPAVDAARRIETAFREAGHTLALDTPTNQVFAVLENRVMARLAEQVEFSFWEKRGETHTVVRLAASWAVTEEEVDRLAAIIASLPSSGTA